MSSSTNLFDNIYNKCDPKNSPGAYWVEGTVGSTGMTTGQCMCPVGQYMAFDSNNNPVGCYPFDSNYKYTEVTQFQYAVDDGTGQCKPGYVQEGMSLNAKGGDGQMYTMKPCVATSCPSGLTSSPTNQSMCDMPQLSQNPALNGKDFSFQPKYYIVPQAFINSYSKPSTAPSQIATANTTARESNYAASVGVAQPTAVGASAVGGYHPGVGFQPGGFHPPSNYSPGGFHPPAPTPAFGGFHPPTPGFGGVGAYHPPGMPAAPAYQPPGMPAVPAYHPPGMPAAATTTAAAQPLPPTEVVTLANGTKAKILCNGPCSYVPEGFQNANDEDNIGNSIVTWIIAAVLVTIMFILGRYFMKK